MSNDPAMTSKPSPTERRPDFRTKAHELSDDGLLYEARCSAIFAALIDAFNSGRRSQVTPSVEEIAKVLSEVRLDNPGISSHALAEHLRAALFSPASQAEPALTRAEILAEQVADKSRYLDGGASQKETQG